MTPAPGTAPPSSEACWPLLLGAASGGRPYSGNTTATSLRPRDWTPRWIKCCCVARNSTSLFQALLGRLCSFESSNINHSVLCFEKITRQSWKILTLGQIWTLLASSQKLTSFSAPASLVSLTLASISWPRSGRGGFRPSWPPSEVETGPGSTPTWSEGFSDTIYSEFHICLLYFTHVMHTLFIIS